MPEPLAKYTCDMCRSRKVACSRHSSGCQRCKAEGIPCSYSRSGVIRRRRKNRDNQSTPATSHLNQTPTGAQPTTQRSSRGGSRRPPDDQMHGATTHERLRRLVGRDNHSLKVLASLFEEYATIRQGSSAFDKLSEGAVSDYYLFGQKESQTWADALVTTLQREKLLLTSVPSEVIENLKLSRPHHVRDRAWLVMFYTIAFSTKPPPDEATKAMLKSNLWLAFNDVRLLLEPSISGIQALVMMACYLEEFMTPSICWSLVSKACIMFQALRSIQWRLDSATRELRNIALWRLNVMDKALALILCRPPTLHREVMTEVSLPTLEQLYHPSSGTPALFNAHYMQQMHLLSRIMSDVWHCLYGQDADHADTVKLNLKSWYSQATEVLESASRAEKPLLSATAAASVDIGITTIRFQYYSLSILMAASTGQWEQFKDQSTHPSHQMLALLPSLDENIADYLTNPYPCLLWQLLHCPLMAFGNLWGEVVMKGKVNCEQDQKSLEAVENVPAFFAKLKSTNPLVAKIKPISDEIVQQAKAVLLSPGQYMYLDDESAREPGPDKRSDLQLSGQEDPEYRSNQAIESNDTLRDAPEYGDFNGQLESSVPWPDDYLLSTTFDWFTWANQ